MRASTKFIGLCPNARQAAPLFLMAALCAAVFTLASRSARADAAACPHVTNGYAFFSGGGSSAVVSGGQVTMEPDDCSPKIHVKVTLSNGQVHDVTESGHLTTVAPQGAGSISDHVYCAAAADLDKQFPIYSIYKDPCTGQTHVFTVSIHIVGNDHDADD